jgi:hypothetical protein
MESTPSRLLLALIAASYAVVTAISAMLVLVRYLQYVRNPQDAAAYGGMWAGGDLILELFICFLFFVPTVALAIVIRKSESLYTTYAKVLLGLSLTAPLSVILILIPILNQWYFGDVLIFRLFAIPLVVVILTFSRFMTRFSRPRRLISYALLIETLTLVLMVGSIFLFSGSHNG